MLSTILLVLEKKRGEALPLCPFHEVGLACIMDPSEVRSRQVPERDADASLATLEAPCYLLGTECANWRTLMA